MRLLKKTNTKQLRPFLFCLFLLCVSLIISCRDKSLSPFLHSDYTIVLPKEFKQLDKNSNSQNSEEKNFFYYGKWAALFIRVTPHSLIESTEELLLLLLEEQLKEFLKGEILAHEVVRKSDGIGVKYFISTHEEDGTYRILMNFDDYKELGEIRLIGNNKKKMEEFYSNL